MIYLASNGITKMALINEESLPFLDGGSTEIRLLVKQVPQRPRKLNCWIKDWREAWGDIRCSRENISKYTGCLWEVPEENEEKYHIQYPMSVKDWKS